MPARSRFRLEDHLTGSLFEDGEIPVTTRRPHTPPTKPDVPDKEFWLHLDMDAFFASCEQMLRKELRGKPVVVVPVRAETTCCIAASYEAKARQVKTGTSLEDARILCPTVRVITARPKLYRAIHFQILRAIETEIPVYDVLSVDEMLVRPGGSVALAESLGLARRLQDAIRRDVGETLSCSVGIGPNPFLAKVASDLQKPKGISVLAPEDLPDKTFGMKLSDWPGIGRRMQQRFHQYGVYTTREMYDLSIRDLGAIFHSVGGERWWRFIRGLPVVLPPVRKRQIGHSSVLAPEFRSVGGAWSIACRLLEKAAERLREGHYHARCLSVSVSSYDGKYWARSARFQSCDETLALLRLLDHLWREHLTAPIKHPSQVHVTLGDILPNQDVIASLFDEDTGTRRIDQVIDALNRQYGRGSICTATALPARDYLNHERIPFGKPTEQWMRA